MPHFKTKPQMDGNQWRCENYPAQLIQDNLARHYIHRLNAHYKTQNSKRYVILMDPVLGNHLDYPEKWTYEPVSVVVRMFDLEGESSDITLQGVVALRRFYERMINK